MLLASAPPSSERPSCDSGCVGWVSTCASARRVPLHDRGRSDPNPGRLAPDTEAPLAGALVLLRCVVSPVAPAPPAAPCENPARGPLLNDTVSWKSPWWPSEW